MIKFSLETAPIETPDMENAACGAFAAFEGRVRNEHGGRDVLRLEYEAHPELAIQEGCRLLEEACTRFGLTDVRAIHRVGRLELGETAIWVGALAPHRKEAFEALAWIMDEFKRRVPIWKKEHYADGDSGWVGIDAASSAAPPTAQVLFERQMRLSEVGAEGQKRLSEARVLVVGAGGLGCAALPYLAAAGIGTLGICDFDRVEASNLHRQVLYGVGDIGRLKTERAARSVRAMHPFVEVAEHSMRLDQQNAEELVQKYDLILDCTDNLRTKFLLNAVAIRHNIALIVASIHKFEGQLFKVDPQAGTPCLQCLWPEPPPDGCVGTCAEVGVLGVVPGVLGTLQAAEAVKHLLGIDSPLGESVLIADLMSMSQVKMSWKRRAECPVCGSGTETMDSVEIEPQALLRMPVHEVVLIDVREEDEPRPRTGLEDRAWLSAPLSRFQAIVGSLDPNKFYVVVCLSGARSLAATEYLRRLGFANVRSLAGGMDLVERMMRA